MIQHKLHALAQTLVRTGEGALNGIRSRCAARKAGARVSETMPVQGAEEVPESALYGELQSRPDQPGALKWPALAFCKAQQEDAGEDSCLALIHEGRALLGVFDGSGGSGGRVYPALGGHTGAWAASRAAALAAEAWFRETPAGERVDAAGLEEHIRRALARCQSEASDGPVLLGSLSKAFPTTMAAFGVDPSGVDFYWCGDSRCYVLDEDGLHQATLDDTAVRDALRNLREDAPMTGVMSASVPFKIHAARLEPPKRCVILAATDGCFGYLLSPMAFETLLLETMAEAKDPADWRRRLEAGIGATTGDDYTMAVWIRGFENWHTLRHAFQGRLSHMRKTYPQEEIAEAEVLRQWAAYRPGYECMLQPDCQEGRDSRAEAGADPKERRQPREHPSERPEEGGL